jgi:6-phosphogluconolactonase
VFYAHIRIRALVSARATIIAILLLLLLCPCVSSTDHAQEAKQKHLVYVGTYTDHGSKGIYSYRFDASTGQLSPLGLAAESAEPSFLAVAADGRFLYAVNELSSFNGKPGGAVSAFSIQADSGKLTLINQVSSDGEVPAHLTLDKSGKHILVSNYDGGSVAVLPVQQDGRLGAASAFAQHKGSSVNPKRQKSPHAHAIALSPDNRFALVADLGLDEILVYRFDAAKGTLGTEPQIAHTAPGAGPRHLVFAPNGRFLYVINEMQSTVVTYSYDDATGRLRELQTISTLPKSFKGENTAAEIAIDPSGKFLFASNRGHDSIAVFAIDSKKGILSPVEIDSTRGKTPRDFALDPTGSWLLAANQDSDEIVIFRINLSNGHLTPSGKTFHVFSPTCITFSSEP